MPEFSVTVTPYEREGSNIKGLARIYFENSFIVNNINIVQGKEKIFVSMPSYKTKQVDEQGKLPSQQSHSRTAYMPIECNTTDDFISS
jgi:DNA-binding cell septation regulator SpoVG